MLKTTVLPKVTISSAEVTRQRTEIALMSYDRNVHQIKIPTDLTAGEIAKILVIFTFPFDESVIQLNGAWVDGHIQFTLPEILRTQRGGFYIEVNIDLTDSQITFARYRAKVVKSDIDANASQATTVYFELFEDLVNEVADNAQQAKDVINLQTVDVEGHANTSKQTMDSDVNSVHDYSVSATTTIDAKVDSVELAKNQALSDIADKQQDVTDASTQFIADLADSKSTIDAQVTQTNLDLAEDLAQVDDAIANINAKNTQVDTLASNFTADVATKQTDVANKYNAFDESVTQANQTIDEILALQPQFQSVLEETTGKDVISAPEIILARDGFNTLDERLTTKEQEVTAQLAQKANSFESDIKKIELEKATKNEVINAINDRVDNITQGGPADTFANLSALQSAYPSGTNKPMLVLESDGVTGYVYTWTGSAWKKGVLYQAQGVGDKSIETIKIADGAVTSTKKTINVYPKDLNAWSFSRYTFVVGQKPEYITPVNNEGDSYRHDTSDLIDVSNRLSNNVYISNFYESLYEVAIHELDANGLAVKDNNYLRDGKITLSQSTCFLRLIVKRIDNAVFNIALVPKLKLNVDVAISDADVQKNKKVKSGNFLSVNASEWEAGGITISNGSIVFNYSEYHWRMAKERYIDVSKIRRLYYNVSDGFRLGIHLIGKNQSATSPFRWVEGEGSFYIHDTTIKLYLLIAKSNAEKLTKNEFEDVFISLSEDYIENPSPVAKDIAFKANVAYRDKKNEWDAFDGVKFIGHAGTEYYAPGNTIEAYHMASLMGHWGAECDLAITKDGHLILMHDYTLDRTTTGSGAVSNYTLDEIKTFKVNSNYWGPLEIPTFEEYLLFCKNNNLYPVIEIKDDGHENGMVEKVMETLQKFDMTNKVIVISFSQYVLNAVRSLNSKIKIARLLKTSDVISDYLINTMSDLGNAALNVYHTNLTKNGVDLAHAKNVPVMTWTLNNVADVNRAMSCGVDMITTDSIYPQVTSGKKISGNIKTTDAGLTWKVLSNEYHLQQKIKSVSVTSNEITIFFDNVVQKAIGQLDVFVDIKIKSSINTMMQVSHRIAADGSITIYMHDFDGIIVPGNLPNEMSLCVYIRF